MALRSGYKGIKKLAAGLKWNRPGILAADDTALAKTFFPRSEQAVLGAINFVRYDELIPVNAYNFYELTSTGIRIYTQSSIANNRTYMILRNLPKNTDMTITTDIVVTSGSARVGMEGFKNGSYTDIFFDEYKTTSGKITNNFNTGDYEYVRVWLYCTGATSEVGNITYNKLLIHLASDSDSTFAPPAMTNKELTDAVAFNNVEITNVNAGITLDTAWSYAYQVGNLVMYALWFTVGASAIAENTILCSFGAECSKSMNADILPRQTGNHFLAALVADTTNHRTDFKTFGGATLTASNEYLVSGFYIAK